jgi:hypothetical protein
MKVTVDIEINQTIDTIWNAITDIENCENFISSVLKINILKKPPAGLVGLKWEETREMFGKEALEIMWITEAVTNEYYCTRAESHGSVYLTKLNLELIESVTLLTMTFTAIPQSFFAKVFSFLMRPLIKKSILKALTKDLEDIKAYVEKS